MNKPESVGRSPASLSYRASWRIFEQFEQIAQCPTWSGDLISISMAARLRKAGLIRRKNPPVRNAGNDCWGCAGNRTDVPTVAGGVCRCHHRASEGTGVPDAASLVLIDEAYRAIRV